MSDEPVQLFVRTDKGATFGPLTPTSVELLLDQGVVTGRVQVSLDGLHYVFPGRLPGIRMVFPRALWGEVIEPGEALDATWAQVVLPLSHAPPTTSPSGIRPGPGLPPASGPSRPPISSPSGISAGPGARALAQQRPPVQAGPPKLTQSAAPAPAPSAPPALETFAPASTPTPDEKWSELATDPNGTDQPSPTVDPNAFLAGDIPPRGSLSSMGPMRLYSLAASADRTGLLTVSLSDRVLQLHFRKGTPELVDSNHAEDSLSLFLVKKQLLTPEVVSQAEAQRGRFGGELLPTLFGLGLLNPNTVFAHLAQRAADLVYRVLVPEIGTYTWQNIELPPTKAMPMGHKWSIFMEQLRRVPAPEVRRRMGPALDLPVMKGQGLVAPSELKLSPQETRALNHFDGVRSLNQLATMLPAEAEVMLRTAWVLQFCDVVSFAAAVLKNEVPPAAPPPPARVVPSSNVISGVPGAQVKPAGAPGGTVPGPPPGNPASIAKPQTVSYPGHKPKPPQLQPAAAPVAPQVIVAPAGPPKISATIASSGSGIAARPLAPTPAPAPYVALSSSVVIAAAAANPVIGAEVKQLTELRDLMRKQNHFEVLAVAKEAENSLIKIAYFKLAKVYHPDTAPEGTPEAIAKLKADIFARVGDAHRTLTDAKLKTEYIAELAAGGTGEKVDISKILAAEELFQKGTILVKARKFSEAVKMLTDAINASDVEAEYYAWRGWAKFFLYPDKKAGQVEAMKDIAICLKKNPNVATVYYFQGFMAKVLGDLASAKANFAKTVQLDPRHIDAQRELRMMK